MLYFSNFKKSFHVLFPSWLVLLMMKNSTQSSLVRFAKQSGHIISHHCQLPCTCEIFHNCLQTKYFLVKNQKTVGRNLIGISRRRQKGETVWGTWICIPHSDAITAKEEFISLNSKVVHSRLTVRYYTTVWRKSILICFLN